MTRFIFMLILVTCVSMSTMAEKDNIKPFLDVQPGEMEKVIKQRIKQQTVSLLQGVAESMGARYDLDAVVVESLYQAMVNTTDRVLGQIDGLSSLANANIALKVLLAQPDCKAAFAEHLSEAQLQDYLDFMAARLRRDQEAVARRITAALDRELSLTANQREKVVKLLRSAAWNRNFPTAMNSLRISSQKAVHLVHHKSKISLDRILSDAQSKVWQGLVEANPPKGFTVVLKGAGEGGDILVEADKHEGHVVIDEILVQADANKKRPLIGMKAFKPVKIEKEVKEVNIVIDMQEQQPGDEINPDTAESQAQRMQRIEAKLAAHTELLGTLDERAARRLALVAKGVAQQYIEAQDKAHEAMDELPGNGETKIDITDHPMYQRTIKDVLSEEAFAAYRAYQAEREVASTSAA